MLKNAELVLSKHCFRCLKAAITGHYSSVWARQTSCVSEKGLLLSMFNWCSLEPDGWQPFMSSAVHGRKEPRGKFNSDVLLHALQGVKMAFKGKSDFIRTKDQNENMPQKQNPAGPDEINDVSGVG
jgi:hypothetical protein